MTRKGSVQTALMSFMKKQSTQGAIRMETTIAVVIEEVEVPMQVLLKEQKKENNLIDVSSIFQ